LLSFSGFGQYQTIVGKVYNKQENLPVPYANITITNSSFGTCSNMNGDFIFYFPDSLFDNLSVSCIGYETLYLALNDINFEDTLNIQLNPVVYNIKDIIITPGENDPTTILKRVIRKIDNNYSARLYYSEGFFRHKVYNWATNDKDLCRLTEAAISIESNELNSARNKLKVLEIRNSVNYVEFDERFNLLMNLLLKGEKNPVYKLLDYKEYILKSTLKKLSKDDNYEILLNKIDFLDTTMVYVIDIKMNSVTILFKKFPTPNYYQILRLYIQSDDYAIVKIQDIWIDKRKDIGLTQKADTINNISTLEYRKINKQYYMSYAYKFGIFGDQTQKMDKEHRYKHEAFLLINNVVIQKRDYDRIKRRNMVKRSKALWDLDFEYNADFWKNYNILIDNPMKKSDVETLENLMPLEKQFEQKEKINN
jgi:hypothetical protein